MSASRTRKLGITFAVSVLAVGLSPAAQAGSAQKTNASAARALADRPSMQLPFACQKSVRLETGSTHDRARSKLVDMYNPPYEGEPVLASHNGTVIRSNYDSGYGNIVVVKDGSGYYSAYAHLLDRAVSYGQYVKQGERVGRLGKSGNGAGGTAHLHYEQHYDYDGDGWDYSGEWVYPVFNGTEYRLSESGWPWSMTVISSNIDSGITSSGRGAWAACSQSTSTVRAIVTCANDQRTTKVYGPWAQASSGSYAWCPGSYPDAVGSNYEVA